MKQLLISIIIPTFNRAAYLDKSIKSALDQMITGDELIVVDDGSEDETPDVLHKYGNLIKVIKGHHGGAGRARNLGIAEAKNELVAFLDSDDIWLPGKLELQRTFMERRPDILFSFTNFEVKYRDGTVRPRYLQVWHREHATWEDAFGPGRMYSSIAPLPEGIPDFWVFEGDLYTLQLTGFYILTDTLVARRQEAGDALHYAEDLKTYEDLECFYRLSKRGRAAFLDADTARQLDHPHGRLSQLAQLDKLDARLTLLRRIWGLDVEFLAKHSDQYRKVLDGHLQQKASMLLSLGKKQMARDSLDEMESPPFLLKILSYAPARLTLAGIKLRRLLSNRRHSSHT